MPRIEKLTTSAAADGVPLLQSISIAVEPGEVHGVIGPSGSGKTLLARALSGLVTLAAGGLTSSDERAVRVAVVPADGPPCALNVRELATLTGGQQEALPVPLRRMSLALLQRGVRQRAMANLLASSSPGLLVVDDPEFASVEEVRAWRETLSVSEVRAVPVLLLSRSEVPLAALCSTMHVLFDGRVIASGRTSALVPGAEVLARKRYA